MPTVNIHAARTHLSRLVDDAVGKETIIAIAGKPVARLAPLIPKRKKTSVGAPRGPREDTAGFRRAVACKHSCFF